MKKFVVVFLLLPFAGMAQFNKGQVFLGGSMTAANQYLTDHNGNINNSFSIAPRAGYFINERWALGVTPGYTSSHSTSTSADINGSYLSKSNSTTLSAVIFGRRYVAISERFLFVLEGNLNFFRSNSTSTYTQKDATGVVIYTSNDHYPSYSLGAGFRPLFVFFPSPKWGIEAGLGSLNVSRQRNLSDHSGFNAINLGVAGTLSFGVTYYFKRS